MQIRPIMRHKALSIEVSPEYFFNKRERTILGLLLKGYTFEQITKYFKPDSDGVRIKECRIRSIADNLYEYLECEEVLEHLSEFVNDLEKEA